MSTVTRVAPNTQDVEHRESTIIGAIMRRTRAIALLNTRRCEPFTGEMHLRRHASERGLNVVKAIRVNGPVTERLIEAILVDAGLKDARVFIAPDPDHLPRELESRIKGIGHRILYADNEREVL